MSQAVSRCNSINIGNSPTWEVRISSRNSRPRPHLGRHRVQLGAWKLRQNLRLGSSSTMRHATCRSATLSACPPRKCSDEPVHYLVLQHDGVHNGVMWPPVRVLEGCTRAWTSPGPVARFSFCCYLPQIVAPNGVRDFNLVNQPYFLILCRQRASATPRDARHETSS